MQAKRFKGKSQKTEILQISNDGLVINKSTEQIKQPVKQNDDSSQLFIKTWEKIMRLRDLVAQSHKR